MPPPAVPAPLDPQRQLLARLGVPAILIPIYQRASDAYGLGPQGPSILAAINKIETAFGTNLNVSSAGAVGWMQFMPATWGSYGVDANGDGIRDPYDPEDAIFAAANYLRASGMPADTDGAIFSYNHADWYVAEVLADASCFGQLGGAIAAAFDLTPKLQVLDCRPAKPLAQAAAGRLPGRLRAAPQLATGSASRGVWALAAVARLESNFGRGMTKAELRRHGPLGLDGTRVAPLHGRRRRRRQDPPRRPRRLGRHAGADDLVAGQPPRRALQPQPGRLVRRGRDRRGEATRRPLQGEHGRLGAGPAQRRDRADQLGEPDDRQSRRPKQTSSAARSTRG